MGVKPATFQSGGLVSQHYIPGAYSRLDFIKGTGGLVSISNAVIFGNCTGGEPGKILWFSGPSHAGDILRSGPLLDAIKHAFKPGEGFTPQFIGGWRVNTALQAESECLKTATVIITLKAWDWGLHTNQLKRKIEAATTSGKKISIQYQNNEIYIVDNIEKESFEILYTGAGSAATMNITKTQLDTTCTGAPADDLVILFSSFTTIESLVNYINDQANYTCTIKTSIPLDPSIELDGASAQDIKTSAYTANSDLQALIDELDECVWIESAEFNDVAATRELPDNDTAWVYFTGGSEGTYTSDEWTTALTAAKEEDIQIVGASSEDTAVHAQIKTHCDECNSIEGKAERQFIVGGAAGETVEQVITRAESLASEYGILAYPGFKHYKFEDEAQTKIWSPAYYAAKLMGMMTCLALPEPATNKQVSVLGWEKVLTKTEQRDLIKAGVASGIKSRAGKFVTVRAINTYQGSELQKCEFSMMREALFAARDLRTAIEESFVGKALSNTLIGKVDGIAYGKLSAYYDMNIFNGRPPYWGYQKTVVGDVVEIEYDCNLTPPTNFLFITSHMHVYAEMQSA